MAATDDALMVGISGDETGSNGVAGSNGVGVRTQGLKPLFGFPTPFRPFRNTTFGTRQPSRPRGVQCACRATGRRKAGEGPATESKA